jgi:iron-sulfur cluster repair protein YtfE (RIC family)
MYSTQYIDPSKLTAPELCDFLEKAFYAEIRQLLETIQQHVDEIPGEGDASSQVELFSLLFSKLKDEVMQMMRNDKLIIFPLIRNDKQETPCPARKLPLQMIQNMHQKIMQLLEKIRQQANNYLPKPGWQPAFIHSSAEMFKLEQEIHKAIYTKENELLKKVSTEFNQPCSGNCNHAD